MTENFFKKRSSWLSESKGENLYLEQIETNKNLVKILNLLFMRQTMDFRAVWTIQKDQQRGVGYGQTGTTRNRKIEGRNERRTARSHEKSTKSEPPRLLET